MAEDLSVDQAVSLLVAPEQASEETQQDEIQAPPTEAEDTGEEQDAPGDGEKADQEAEAEAQALEPPPMWDAEDKAWFAEQSPEAQAKILKQEAKRESVTSKAKQEAAEARKAAEAEAKRIGELAQKAQDTFSKVEQTFRSRWESVDWVAYAQGVRDGQYDQAEYLLNKEQYEAEKRQIDEARQLAEKTWREQMAQRSEEQKARLSEMAPELTGEKSAANQQALIGYLKAQGATAQDFEIIDTNAFAATMAWKAHQYDKAQEALKSRPKPAPIPQKGNVAPVAAPTRTSQQRSVEQINARFQKSGSVDDGVALLLAKGI